MEQYSYASINVLSYHIIHVVKLYEHSSHMLSFLYFYDRVEAVIAISSTEVIDVVRR